MPKFVNTESMSLYMKFMDSYNDTGKTLLMTIEEYSNDVTDKQYAMFKALVIEGSNTSGYTYNEFEDELITTFAPYRYQVSIIGGKVKIRKRVPEMNHREFNIFIEQSIQFCAEFYDIKF